MKLETLRSVPLFRELDDELVFELCGLMTVRDVPSGNLLFRHGDNGDAMYLIESGYVRISVMDTEDHEVTLAELGDGEFFGEMALLDGQPRSADATVLEEARLNVLARNDFLFFLRKNPRVAIGILRAITHRLRRTDELLRHRVSRNANEEEAARLTVADRSADAIAEFGGSWKFIAVSIVFIFCWIGLNSWLLLDKAFDPYAYVLLNLVFCMILSLQAPVIMMSQNRQEAKDRLRADLDYRVNLKNELSLSEIMRRLDMIEGKRSSNGGKEGD